MLCLLPAPEGLAQEQVDLTVNLGLGNFLRLISGTTLGPDRSGNDSE